MRLPRGQVPGRAYSCCHVPVPYGSRTPARQDLPGTCPLAGGVSPFSTTNRTFASDKFIGDMKSEVYNIDCMTLMRSMPDGAFALAIADPPYGIRDAGGATGGAGKLRGRAFNNGKIDRWDKAPEQEFFDELRRVSEHQIIWGGNYFALPPTRCFVCWNKVQPWPNFSQAEYAWTSFSSPAKMFTFDNRTGDKIHPTQKPVELYAYLLQQFAPMGG